jgi:AMMECR1 domain-containing protein
MGELSKAPFSRKYPTRVVIDLTILQPFGTICWVYIKKARRPGKSNANEHGKQGILVGYDDCQGLLLANVYFSNFKMILIS